MGRRVKRKPAPVDRSPEEIPDAEHELVIERVAAIDVAKASGKVCVRLPGKRRAAVQPGVGRGGDAPARSPNWPISLVESGIEKVTVESTSDYWRIWYYLLEAAGLSVQLVNARDVKNVPGRPKTDKLDAVWLAKLTEKGLLRPSFVPPAEIRQLRDYTRLRVDLTRERTRYWQRLEKLLEDALIKVSAVASTLDTLSARDMIEALIAGERDPRRLAELARGRMKAKRAALIAALDGRFDDHHARARPDAAGPDRRADRPDRHPHQPDRGSCSAAMPDARSRAPTTAPARRRTDAVPGHPTDRRTGSARSARGRCAAQRRRAPRRDPRHRRNTTRR